MSFEPRLSIGMPVYNGERYLAQALTSLIEQTYTDFEILVLDNASSDRTAEIVAAFMARDPRIRYQRNETNIGASPNFAKVARLTKAPFFKWAAHDDLHAPTYLEACMHILETNPHVVLSHSDQVYIGESGQDFERGAPGTFVDPSTGMVLPVDREDLAETGGALRRFSDVVFNSRIGSHMFGIVRRSALDRTRSIQNIPSSDRPFLAEMALLGPFKHAREPLFLKRFHPSMTWALTGDAVRAYVSGSNARYSPLGRKLQVYLTATTGKSIGPATKVACCGVVLAYSGKVALRNLARRWQRGPGPLLGSSAAGQQSNSGPKVL